MIIIIRYKRHSYEQTPFKRKKNQEMSAIRISIHLDPIQEGLYFLAED